MPTVIFPSAVPPVYRGPTGTCTAKSDDARSSPRRKYSTACTVASVAHWLHQLGLSRRRSLSSREPPHYTNILVWRASTDCRPRVNTPARSSCMEYVVAAYPHPDGLHHHQLPQPPLPLIPLPFCLQRLHPFARPRLAAPPLLLLTCALGPSSLHSRPERCVRPSQCEPSCFADHVALSQRRRFGPLFDHLRRHRLLASEPGQCLARRRLRCAFRCDASSQ